MGQKRDESRIIENWKLYCIMLTMLVCGTANTIVMKGQDKVEIGPQIDGKKQFFTHPYFQCANMFVGEFTCLGIYFIRKYLKGRKGKDGQGVPLSPGTQQAQQTTLRTDINPLLLAIPACCDVMGSTFMFIALTQCAASVYQMMRGVIVVITAILSIVFLGAKQYAHHWISLAMIVCGVSIVGYVSVNSSDHTEDDGGEPTTTILGIILLLVSQIFTGMLFVFEEKFLSMYYLDPFQVIGYEGLWGSIVFAIALPIFQQIKCDGALCHNGYLEDTKTAFQQLMDYPQLAWMSLAMICSIALFNATGVAITKYASAAQRSTIDTSRTILIWCFSLWLGWEHFLPWELLGFFLLASGTFIYNEIIIIPIDFMSRNTREELAKRETSEGRVSIGAKDSNAYMASSPAAAYDSNRNLRNLEAKKAERAGLLEKHDEHVPFVMHADQQDPQNQVNTNENSKDYDSTKK